ncbi:MAG TPA: tRNA (adenosine(37)-N6)-threonylcarbamoyltransferase complex dimerization subunit type 1 TsaB [Gemmatimonadaceae bacterium]|nr:tRNA (adenosine(37)-N6)-threonylcarbamoyltransferase complex dimerization subunit type 1 TsaB [Gemmatimonadaceae bacterium]
MKKKETRQNGSKGAARSYTLALEGATYEGSVALLADSIVVAERTIRREEGEPSSMRSGERLMPAVAECLMEVGVDAGEIARIVCGAGPGSFTSLRVAASVAKGLAAGYGVELFAVSSLLLAVTGAQPPLVPGEYLSVLNAMRGELFAARVILESAGVASLTGPATIITVHQLAEIVEKERGVKVIGPAQLCDVGPHARGVAPLLESIIESGPVDLASWEPDYGRLAEAQVRWEAAHGRPLSR